MVYDRMLLNISHTVDANTTIANGSYSTVATTEGSSVTISCISTGAPTPSVSWELDGQPVPFQSTETREQSTVTLSLHPGDFGSPFVLNTVLGRVTSNLLVVNPQYPDHDGVYTCIGSNDDSMINTSSAVINVQVIGK